MRWLGEVREDLGLCDLSHTSGVPDPDILTAVLGRYDAPSGPFSLD